VLKPSTFNGSALLGTRHNLSRIHQTCEDAKTHSRLSSLTLRVASQLEESSAKCVRNFVQGAMSRASRTPNRLPKLAETSTPAAKFDDSTTTLPNQTQRNVRQPKEPLHLEFTQCVKELYLQENELSPKGSLDPHTRQYLERADQMRAKTLTENDLTKATRRVRIFKLSFGSDCSFLVFSSKLFRGSDKRNGDAAGTQQSKHSEAS